MGVQGIFIQQPMGRARKGKIWAFFGTVDGAEKISDKNIFFTSMNFDVVTTISLLVES